MSTYKFPVSYKSLCIDEDGFLVKSPIQTSGTTGKKTCTPQQPKDVNSWGLTSLETNKFSIYWTIRDIFKLIHSSNTGDVITSQTYYIPQEEPVAAVTLRCYPQGYSKDYRRMFGLFFKLEDTEMKNVFIKLKFEILPIGDADRHVKSIKRLTPAHVHFSSEGKTRSWGCADFVSFLKLFQGSDTYISKSNCLGIKVSGLIHGQHTKSGLMGENNCIEELCRDIRHLRFRYEICATEFDLMISSSASEEIFHVHRVIIAAVNETFEILLSDEDVIKFEIGDYDEDVIQLFLEYAYNNHNLRELNYGMILGKITVLAHLMKLALAYNVDRLKALCEVQLRNCLAEEEFLLVKVMVETCRYKDDLTNSVSSLYVERMDTCNSLYT